MKNRPFLTSVFLDPVRVFIGLLLAVLAWLAPVAWGVEEAAIVAGPGDADARGPCSDVRCDPGFCCKGGYCVTRDCHPGDPPPPPLRPPTISGNLTCDRWGEPGWCLGGLVLNLRASDPQGAGLQIYAWVNGVESACPVGTGCLVHITQEGSGRVDYEVHATTGLRDEDSLAYQLDQGDPLLDLAVEGRPGSDGWLVSPAAARPVGEDAVSGLAWVEVSAEGSGWTGALELGDGVHLVAVRGGDQAGRTVEAGPWTIKVDTLAPRLASRLVGGTMGGNGWWYVGPQAQAEVEESGSGLAVFIAAVDHGEAFAYTEPIALTSEGEHVVEFLACDGAGNCASSSQTAQVDLSPPKAEIALDGTQGAQGWWRTRVGASVAADDPGSGVEALQVSVNGGAWEPYLGEMYFDDGEHTLGVRVSDGSGRAYEALPIPIWVDTHAPVLVSGMSGALGLDGWYVSPARAWAEVSEGGSGVERVRERFDGGEWREAYGPIEIFDGEHTLEYEACDRAGWCAAALERIKVDTRTPLLELRESGPLGGHGWYLGPAQVDGEVSDDGSGVGRAVMRLDGGAQAALAFPIAFSTDGVHAYQLEVCDRAGNCTEVPAQQVKIDTRAPSVTPPQGWELGRAAYMEAQDTDSGLSHATFLIEGQRSEVGLSGGSDREELYWNGRNGKGERLSAGGYEGVLKVFDLAGNESREEVSVQVSTLGSLVAPFLPAGGEAERANPPPAVPAAPRVFGGETTTTAAGPVAQIPVTGGGVSNPFTQAEGSARVQEAASPGKGVASEERAGTTTAAVASWGWLAAGVAGVSLTVGALQDELGRKKLERALLGGTPPPPVEPPTPPIDPPPVEPPTPPPPQPPTEEPASVIATATPRPGPVVPIRAPIAPGTPLIPRNPPRMPVPSPEQVKTGLDVTTDSANAMVDYDDLRSFPRLGLEVPVNSSWVESKLIKSVDSLVLPFTEIVDDLNLWAAGKTSLGKMALNAADNNLNRASIATAATSIAGNAMSWHGIQHGKKVADAGTVSGAVVDAGSMVTGTIKLFNALKTGIAPAVGTLAKVGGALAIPLGALVLVTEGAKAYNDWEKDGDLSQEGKASAWNAAGGLLTTAGGILLFAPGVGPIIGGICLAAGGVCSGVSWYVQNQQQVNAYVSNSWNSICNTVNTVATNVKNTVAQAVNTAKNAATKTITKVTETVKNTVANTIKAVTETAKNAVTNTVKAVAQAPKIMVKAVTNTVKAVTATAKNTVKSIGNAISKWFKPKS